MSVSTKLADIRESLNQMLRKRQFNKNNAARREAAELQASLAKCRGQLEICKNDINRTIRSQSRHIAEGERIGADTTIQEQMLWDAAIGYMLVRDAIYSLKSVTTQESISHAYDILDAAVEQMSGKHPRHFKLPKFRLSPERNVYAHLTSEAVIQEKSLLLDGFFEELKRTGNIENCLNGVRRPAAVEADRRRAYSPGSAGESREDLTADEMDRYSAILSSLPDEGSEEMDTSSLDSLTDIHPPVE